MIYASMNNGHIAYNVKCFTLDTDADIDYLPIDTANVMPGSKAFVIESEKKLMLNGNGEWKPVTNFPW